MSTDQQKTEPNPVWVRQYLDFLEEEWLRDEISTKTYRELRRGFEIQQYGESLTYDENLNPKK